MKHQEHGALGHYTASMVGTSDTLLNTTAATISMLQRLKPSASHGQSIFPHLYTMPTTSSADAAMEAARDFTCTLQSPHPSNPFAQVRDKQLVALRQLAEIFVSNIPDPTSTIDQGLVPPVPASPTPSHRHKIPAPDPRVTTITPRSFIYSGRQHINTQPSPSIVVQPPPRVPILTLP